MRTPRLSGYALASIARLARSGAGGVVLKTMMRRDLGVGRLAALPDTPSAATSPSTRARFRRAPPRSWEDARHPPPGDSAWAGTSDSFARAYREGATTPREVIERALDGARELAAQTPPVGPLLDVATSAALEAAEASGARWKGGRPKGPMDGVPFAVKEETAVRGLARRSGAPYSDASLQLEDATCIARLRARGAIPIGTTPMTEWGMTPFGCNPHRTMPRNPHATEFIAGGSSTGSGVAVATRARPIRHRRRRRRVDPDPRGLLRDLCDQADVGRVSRHGDTSAGSLSHLGPLPLRPSISARALELMGPPDTHDSQTRAAPPIAHGSLERALSRGVKGLRVGIERGANGATPRAACPRRVRRPSRRSSARGRRSSTCRFRSPASRRRSAT